MKKELIEARKAIENAHKNWVCADKVCVNIDHIIAGTAQPTVDQYVIRDASMALKHELFNVWVVMGEEYRKLIEESEKKECKI